jgi:hypothetical protein
LGSGLAGYTININQCAFTTGGQLLGISGSIGLPTTIPLFAGLTATGSQFGFSQSGLSMSGTINIPSNLIEGLPQAISINSLVLGWNGSLQNLNVGIAQATVQLAGFTTDIQNLDVNNTGITIQKAVLTLPPNLGGQQISLVNAGFDVNGNFTGVVGVNEVDQNIAGFTLKLSNLSVNIATHAINIGSAQVSTPAIGTLHGTVQLNGVSLLPSGLSLGGVGFSLPNFDYGGIGFRSIFLNFSVTEILLTSQGVVKPCWLDWGPWTRWFRLRTSLRLIRSDSSGPISATRCTRE